MKYIVTQDLRLVRCSDANVSGLDKAELEEAVREMISSRQDDIKILQDQMKISEFSIEKNKNEVAELNEIFNKIPFLGDEK